MQCENKPPVSTDTPNLVKHFRQILLLPLQLNPLHGSGRRNHWELLQAGGEESPWQPVEDEFTADPNEFSERHYFEFVSFLPFVQRFLYGELDPAQASACGSVSPLRVFRHRSVAKARITLQRGAQPVELRVAHADLYFFFDVDVALFNIEVAADDLTLDAALELLDGFRRAYPVRWDDDGHAARCPARVEFLDPQGNALAVSDYERKQDYLAFVGEHRALRLASHWQALLAPLAPVQAPDTRTRLRYRLIEDDRIPAMTYLAVDDPHRLTRGDFVRMAFGTGKGQGGGLPYGARFLRDFEARYCYDRYWVQAENEAWQGARYLCTGAILTLVGNAGDPFFTGSQTGLLGQFRHQLFLLGLIVHFHKAALLMMSDRLSQAVNRLVPGDRESVRVFQRDVRADLEIFLRFDHRYFFHEVSNQAQASDLYRMWSGHLATDALFNEVRQEAQDINNYLDSVRAKKLADIGVRLGVVATEVFIGVMASSFLGMNLIDEADNQVWVKVGMFVLVLVPTALLTFYTVHISKGLADFLDALSSERASLGQKWNALLDVWRKRGKR